MSLSFPYSHYCVHQTQVHFPSRLWTGSSLSTFWYISFSKPPRETNYVLSALSHLSDSSMSLPQLISTSQTTKARLLHYFPPASGTVLPSDDEPVDSWCGFHLDHSLLTGLCSVRTKQCVFVQHCLTYE